MIKKREYEIMKNWGIGIQTEVVVSIRCITYNHEKYIAQCLDGFLMQETTFPFEIIVHDDASTDRTAEIIREYENRFPHIIHAIYEKENLYSKRDGSLSNVINSCLKGKYIALCEGDDFWIDPQKIQMQYDALEQHPECSICTCLVKCCDEDGTPNKRVFPAEALKLCESKVIEKRKLVSLLCSDYPFHTSSYFFRHDAFLDSIEGVTNLFRRDVGFMLKAALFGNLYYIHRPMSMRRYGVADGWNQRIKKQGKTGASHIATDDYRMFLAFDRHTQGEFRDTVFPKLCASLLAVVVSDSNLASSLKSECIQAIGEADYNKRFQCVLRSYAFTERVMLAAFDWNPRLFLGLQRIWHVVKK